ncbi:MAG: EAL domain-containing protein, partial [Oscillibacter sp.]
MPMRKSILIVDDHEINRKILSKILSEDYQVLWAENGSAAIDLLNQHPTDISAVLLDIVMPVMDGYDFLQYVHQDPRYQNLPILVATENNDTQNEIKVLALGAWDFISKPYNAEIIRFRLKNAIDRSQLGAFTELKYLAEYDSLTGIYNKTKFFDATAEMLRENSGRCFALLRLDVDRFQLINSFFGVEEGDRILLFIAERLQSFAYTQRDATCGRIGSDVFCLCMPYDEETTERFIRETRTQLSAYNPNYDMVPSIGVYLVKDPAVSVETMYNRAALAAKTCKGNYVDYYAYYNENMSVTLAWEQEIVNGMNSALDHHEFEIYLQPKYRVSTAQPCGAEALVRWNHPQKGLLLPGEFISIFERNGFITKLDPYVWEQTCQCLHNWISQGHTPLPISVNISRVNVYNPQLVEILMELVTRYEIDPSLLQLELTESAYTDNPTAMSATITRLQSQGFTILMDDFGSGYSSLSILKDIAVDVLKIDMRFLSQSKIPGRGENIIASVIRMAKWLGIPVVTEGVETGEQVEFLKSVGCEYIQGYYFARPMPVSKYEAQFLRQTALPQGAQKRAGDLCDSLFSANPQVQGVFNNPRQATAICEFFEDQVEFLRVNELFCELLNRRGAALEQLSPLTLTAEKDREVFLGTFRLCAETEEPADCECTYTTPGGSSLWLHICLQYVARVEEKSILVMEVADITTRKEIDFELQKYRASLLSDHNDAHTILIVDDGEINRRILRKIFENKYSCL